MERTARIWFTPQQRAELWERWTNGQCVADIHQPSLSSPSTPFLGDHPTATLLYRSESLVAGYGLEKLVVIISVFRLFRSLHLEQIHVPDHAPVFTHAAALREKIIDGDLLHFLDNGLCFVGPRLLDRLQIMQHRAIGPGVRHRRHLLGPVHVALTPCACFIG